MQKWAVKITLTVTLLVLSPICVSAFQNEPLGFRGIRWGTHIDTLTDMKMIDERSGIPIKRYVRKNEKKKIGNASLKNIFYIFRVGELDSVVIDYKSHANHEILKKTFFEAYGKGYQLDKDREKYYWSGVQVKIELAYDKVSQEGSIEYDHKAFWGDWGKDRAVESAAPDL